MSESKQDPLPWNNDAPDGKRWCCPDCSAWATLGDNAAFHASRSGHRAPILENLLPQKPSAREINADLLAACKAAKKYLEPDLVEPGRTVFWKLVEAIAKSEQT